MPQLVKLERPSLEREGSFIAAALRSRSLHRGRVMVPATPAEYRALLAATNQSERAVFLIVSAADELVGGVELREISAVSARLGYYAFEPRAGRGFVRAGVALALTHAFGALGLERVEAEIQLANRRSIALAESLGFARFGTKPRARKIGTRWCDHAQWALSRLRVPLPSSYGVLARA